MTTKDEALFVVRLPYGQQAIPYEEVLNLIATATFPSYPPEDSDQAEVIFVLNLGLYEVELSAAVHRGEVEVLDHSTFLPLRPPFGRRFSESLLTVKAFRRYVESINGFVEVEEEPEQQTNTLFHAPVLAARAPAGTLTVWTTERKDEARRYRDKHGLKKTAEHYQVSQATISKHIPAGKTQQKALGPWGGLRKK